MRIRTLPILQEAELRQLVTRGAEVELVCLKAPDKHERSRGEWVLMVHWQDQDPLVLVSVKSRHRIFYRFEGLCAYCAHTLELAEVRVPLQADRSCRGMYHHSLSTGAV